MSGAEYKKLYGNCKLLSVSDDERKNLSNIQKNRCKEPGVLKQMSDVQKNGSSQFTMTYWIGKGYSKEDSVKKISEIQKNNWEKLIEKPGYDRKKISWLCNEYWLERGYTEEDAKKIISKKQSILSSRSTKFLGCKRTDEQKEKISKSLKQLITRIGNGTWAKHFGDFNGRSKVEIEMYNYIKENIDSSVEANIPIENYIVDVIKDNRIIEFYGDFWHANPLIYDKFDMLKGFESENRNVVDIWNKDKNRIERLKEIGYDVMIIWESDWNKNKQECVDRIRKYLL